MLISFKFILSKEFLIDSTRFRLSFFTITTISISEIFSRSIFSIEPTMFELIIFEFFSKFSNIEPTSTSSRVMELGFRTFEMFENL